MAGQSGSRAGSIREWITTTFAPKVLVIADENVERACSTNGLSFADMLRPFQRTEDIDVPVRTTGESGYRLREFEVHFFSAEGMEPVSEERAEQHLNQVIQSWNEKASAARYGSHLAPSADGLIERAPYIDRAKTSPSPWFDEYEANFLESLHFLGHEALDYPVAAVVAASASNDDPLETLSKLWRTHNLPSLLQGVGADSSVLVHYVLLVNEQDELPEENVQRLLQRAEETFPSARFSCIRINAKIKEGTSPTNREVEAFTTARPLLSRRSSDAAPSCENLSAGDLKRLKKFVRDFIGKNVIPHLEYRLRSLAQEVTNARRSIRNPFFNFWGSRGEGADVKGKGQKGTPVKWQARLAGDVAFFLRNYELAGEYYRSALADFKHAKDWKKAAAVEEALGFTACLADSDLRSSHANFDSAFSHYQRMDEKVCSKLATRSLLYAARVLDVEGHPKEAANPLVKASHEDHNLRSALLLERAAYCFLAEEPPLLRRFGFYQMLAGHRYNRSGQRGLAIQAYVDVIPICKHPGWSAIHEHLNFVLARQVANIGDFSGATSFFLELFEKCGGKTVSVHHNTVLEEFLYVASVEYGDVKDQRPFESLTLPLFHDRSLQVHFENQRRFANAETMVVQDDEWRALEETATRGFDMQETSTLSAWKSGETEEDKPNYSVAHESIEVDVHVENPLGTGIELSGMQLECFLHCCEVNDAESSDQYEVTTRNVTLQAWEKALVRLAVIPHTSGTLQIEGVKWILCRKVVGYHSFEVPAPLTRLGSDNSWRKNIPPHQRLAFNVMPPMPLLRATVEGIPGFVSKQSVHTGTLTVRNDSSVPCQSLQLAVSTPQLLVLGRANQNEHEHVLDRLKASRMAQRGKDAHVLELGGEFSERKEDSWSIVLCPTSEIARNRINMVLVAWSINTNGQLCARTLCFTLPVEASTAEIRDSLHATSRIFPCYVGEQKNFTVQVCIANEDVQSNVQPLCLKVFNGYSLRPLEENEKVQSLSPQEQMTLHFGLEEHSLSEALDFVRLTRDSQPDIDAAQRVCASGKSALELLGCFVGEVRREPRADAIIFWKRGDELGFNTMEMQKVDQDTGSPSTSTTLGGVESFMQGKTVVSHDFNQGPCFVPLALSVWNMRSADVDVYLDCHLDTDSSADGIRPSVMWCGVTKQHLGPIGPGQEERVDLSALVFSPGLHDLSRIRLLAREVGDDDSGEKELSEVECQPHYVNTIDPTDSSG